MSLFLEELAAFVKEQPFPVFRFAEIVGDGEPETVEPDIPAEITKAGYSVPADSPYRNPASRGRRRRFRVSLLGDSRDEGEIHYFAPRPMIDKKDAYNAPVYPEKWTGSREEDS